jgi:hypothetical protein
VTTQTPSTVAGTTANESTDESVQTPPLEPLATEASPTMLLALRGSSLRRILPLLFGPGDASTMIAD